MNFEEWLCKALEEPMPQGWRRGQILFMTLSESRPAIAWRVLNNYGVDPFHSDRNLKRFYCFVKELWETSEEDHMRIVDAFNALSDIKDPTFTP